MTLALNFLWPIPPEKWARPHLTPKCGCSSFYSTVEGRMWWKIKPSWLTREMEANKCSVKQQQQLWVSSSQIGAASSFVCGPPGVTGTLLSNTYQVACIAKVSYPMTEHDRHIRSELDSNLLGQAVGIQISFPNFTDKIKMHRATQSWSYHLFNI